MKKFVVEDRIFDLFPDTHIGVILAKGIDNHKALDHVDFILRESERTVIEKYEGASLLELPEIKNWREAYKTFGAKKGRRVSIESMLKRVLKGDKIPNVNSLVDIYNSISMRYVFLCGGEDLDKITGDLRLTLAEGDEIFKTIGSEVNEPPNQGEVVYKDDGGCVCRCWNWREADRTKLDVDTQNAILIIETLDEKRANDLKRGIVHLSELVSHLLGAETKTTVLNKENRVVNI